MRIPFGEMAPDIADLDSGVMVLAENVLPGANSYTPFLGPSVYSAAMAAAPRALFMAQKQDGSFVAFSGTATTLTRLNSSTLAWDDVTRTAGGAYSVPTDELWSMAQWGTYVIAVNINDAPQAFEIEAGSNYAALGGSPPQARIVAVVEAHVMLGALSTDPNAIHWSGVDSATSWTAGTAGSDTQSFPEGGRVMAIAPAAKIIVQERALRRIIYTPNDPTIFQFEKVEEAKGTIAPYSVVQVGEAIGYFAEDGFWLNGEPIGKDKIDNYFFSEVNQSRLFKVLGARDPIKPLIYWAYHTGATDLLDRMLVYNWRTRRWSVVSLNQYIMAPIGTPGITLEGLDTPYPNLDTDPPYSLDSRVWLGGRPVTGVVGSDFKLAFLEGSALEATLRTGEMQLFPGRRGITRLVRPLITGTDGENAVVKAHYRERMGDTASVTSESSMTSSGACPVRASGRYHAFTTRIPAASDWGHIQGIEVEAGPAGVR